MMRRAISILIISAIALSGCDIQFGESSIVAIKNPEQSHDAIKINAYVDDIINEYKNKGLLGIIGLINDCHATYSNEIVKCISYEYTGYFIDKGMSELNNFSIDEFFEVENINNRIFNTNSTQSEINRHGTELMEFIRDIVEDYFNAGGNSKKAHT
jgi:hypothetical protein